MISRFKLCSSCSHLVTAAYRKSSTLPRGIHQKLFTDEVEREKSMESFSGSSDDNLSGNKRSKENQRLLIPPYRTFNPQQQHLSDKLSAQIWDFYLENRQSKAEHARKLKVVGRLQETVNELVGDDAATVYVTGSTVTGFGAADCDVDCTVFAETQRAQYATKNDRSVAAFLQKLRDCIRERDTDLISHAYLAARARVPLLMLKVANEAFEVDVTTGNCAPIQNTHLLYHYAEYDWRVRPLVLAVKQWAKRAQIYDARNGLLSSYSLELMVLHFLQCGLERPLIPYFNHRQSQRLKQLETDLRALDYSPLRMRYPNTGKDLQYTLSYLLQGFFEYYGAFPFDKRIICVRNGCAFDKDGFKRPRHLIHLDSQYINILDPYTKLNVAYAVHTYTKYVQILEAFVEAYRCLRMKEDLDALFARYEEPKQISRTLGHIDMAEEDRFEYDDEMD